MNMLRFFTLALVISVSQSHAGEKGGNGGFVVILKDESYVLDLYEANLHQEINHPVLEDTIEAESSLDSQIPNLDPRTAKYFSNRLNAIALRSRALAWRLREILLNYDWRISPKKFIPVDDLGPTPYDRKEMILSRAAFRDDKMKVVWLSSEDWSGLDARNRSALVMHELVYALAVDTMSASTSENVRLAVSLIYSPNMDKLKTEVIFERFERYLNLKNLNTDAQGMSCADINANLLNLFNQTVRILNRTTITHDRLENRGTRACDGARSRPGTHTATQILQCYVDDENDNSLSSLLLAVDGLPIKAVILNAIRPESQRPVRAELQEIYLEAQKTVKEDLTDKCARYVDDVMFLKYFLE